LKTSFEVGEGWLKTSEYHHMGKGVQNCSKNRHMIFERYFQLCHSENLLLRFIKTYN